MGSNKDGNTTTGVAQLFWENQEEKIKTLFCVIELTALYDQVWPAALIA